MVLGDADMARGTDYRQGQVFSLSATKNASTLLPYWPDSALRLPRSSLRKPDTRLSRSENPGRVTELDCRRRKPRLSEPTHLDPVGKCRP